MLVKRNKSRVKSVVKLDKVTKAKKQEMLPSPRF